MTPPPIPEGSATKPWGWVQVLLITIFVLPLMLLGVAALSLGGKALFGPVNVFNASRHIVPESEIAGFYAVRSRDVEDLPAKGIYLSDRSGMRLNEDHTMEALDLPAFEKDGSPQACHYDGKGTWSLMQVNESIRLKLVITTPAPPQPGELPSCGLISPPDLRMLGHSQPFRFWYQTIPDGYSGLMYERRWSSSELRQQTWTIYALTYTKDERPYGDFFDHWR